MNSPSLFLKPIWSCKPPTTVAIVGVPLIIASMWDNPKPSAEEGLQTTSATLYNLFNADTGNFCALKITFISGSSAFATTGRSVPLLSTGSVCNIIATFSWTSLGNLDLNSLNPANRSAMPFLLIFLLFKNAMNL